MKDRIPFSNLFISLEMWKIVQPTTDLKTHKKVVYNELYDLTLKPSIRYYF